MFMMRVLSTIRREGKGKESDLITVGGPPSPPPPRPARAAPAAARPGDIHFSFCDFSVPKCVLVIESSCRPHLRIVSHMRTVIRTRIQSLFSGGFQGYSCTVAVISETDPPPRPVVKKRHTPVQRGNTGETTSGRGGSRTSKTANLLSECAFESHCRHRRGESVPHITVALPIVGLCDNDGGSPIHCIARFRDFVDRRRVVRFALFRGRPRS